MIRIKNEIQKYFMILSATLKESVLIGKADALEKFHTLRKEKGLDG